MEPRVRGDGGSNRPSDLMITGGLWMVYVGDRKISGLIRDQLGYQTESGWLLDRQMRKTPEELAEMGVNLNVSEDKGDRVRPTGGEP